MKFGHKKIIILFISSVILAACGNNAPAKLVEPFKGCKMGKPKPIFELGMAHISNQKFELQPEAGVEEVLFDNGNTLTIRQSGCDVVHQEFNFLMQGDYTKASENACMMLAINQLYFLSKISPKLYGFQGWAQAMEAKIKEIKLAAPFELEKGFFVKIDKEATTTEKANFKITLFQ